MTTMIDQKDRKNTAATYTVLSRHNTSQGVVTWVRCDRCSALRMHMQPASPNGVAIAAGRHGDCCPNCG